MKIEIPDGDRSSVVAALRSRAAYWRRGGARGASYSTTRCDPDPDLASRLDQLADVVERDNPSDANPSDARPSRPRMRVVDAIRRPEVLDGSRWVALTLPALGLAEPSLVDFTLPQQTIGVRPERGRMYWCDGLYDPRALRPSRFGTEAALTLPQLLGECTLVDAQRGARPMTDPAEPTRLGARLRLLLHPGRGDVRRAELVDARGEVVVSWVAEGAAADVYEAVAHLALALTGVVRDPGAGHRVDLGTPASGCSRDSCLRVWEVVLSGSLLAAARLARAYLAMDEVRLREVSRLSDGDAHLQASARWALRRQGEDRALGRLRCAQEWAELGWVDGRELSALHVATLRVAHDGSGTFGDPVRDAVIRHWCAVAEGEDGSVQDDDGSQRVPTDAEVEEARTVLARAWNDARRRHPSGGTAREGRPGAGEVEEPEPRQGQARTPRVES